MEEVLLRELMLAPPQHWNEIERRFEVLEAFTKLSKPPFKELERHAAMLGIGWRAFYNLVRIHRERKAGFPFHSTRKGTFRRLDPEVEHAIEEALNKLQTMHKAADVYDEVVRICAARRLNPPSITTILSRLRSSKNGLNIGRQLGIDADSVLDCSALYIDLVEPQGTKPATLLVLLDARNAAVLHHQLLAGAPLALDAAAAVRLANEGNSRVIATAAFIEPLQGLDWAIPSTLHVEHGLRPGSALRAAFGRHVGRIGVAPRRQGTSSSASVAAVPANVARDVIEALIFQRNDELRR